MEDILIVLDDDFSSYLSDIRENEDVRIANEEARIANERLRNACFEELLADKRSYYQQFYRLYKTTMESECTFALPSEYTWACMVNVYVNGLFLNPTEYVVDGKSVVLARALDVIGTVVEIVVMRAVGITEGDYDALRGYSAYDVAVLNGFDGTEVEWLASLKGVGAYNRRATYYTTVSGSETSFAMPDYYQPGCFKEVFVNGMKLRDDEFLVEATDGGYCLVLANALDVVGTKVEIDVIESDVPEEGAEYIASGVDYLENYYLKGETYSKEEVDEMYLKEEELEELSNLEIENLLN